MKRNVSLDFFRGVMAIAVALGHFFYWNNQHDKMPLSFILAVDFFLVLSGFVIAASVFNKENLNAYRFIQNRYFRLMPVYLFCALVSIIPQYFMAGNFAKPNSLDALRILLLGEMLPMENLRFIYFEPLGISYTISAEFWVGILLFPMVFFVRKRASELLFPLLIVLTLFPFLKIVNDTTNFMNIHYDKAYPFIPYGIIRCLLDYSLGILAYLIYEQQNNRTTEQLGATLWQFAIIVVCFLLYRKISYNRVNEFIFPFICACFIISLAKRRGVIFHWFNNKIGNFFGDISYPIYLIHPFFINLFQWMHQEFNYQTGVIYLIFCIVTAYLIHKWIEKPCMVYFSKRLK